MMKYHQSVVPSDYEALIKRVKKRAAFGNKVFLGEIAEALEQLTATVEVQRGMLAVQNHANNGGDKS